MKIIALNIFSNCWSFYFSIVRTIRCSIHFLNMRFNSFQKEMSGAEMSHSEGSPRFPEFWQCGGCGQTVQGMSGLTFSDLIWHHMSVSVPDQGPMNVIHRGGKTGQPRHKYLTGPRSCARQFLSSYWICIPMTKEQHFALPRQIHRDTRDENRMPKYVHGLSFCFSSFWGINHLDWSARQTHNRLWRKRFYRWPLRSAIVGRSRLNDRSFPLSQKVDMEMWPYRSQRDTNILRNQNRSADCRSVVQECRIAENHRKNRGTTWYLPDKSTTQMRCGWDKNVMRICLIMTLRVFVAW
jgi:hypothetical protein